LGLCVFIEEEIMTKPTRKPWEIPETPWKTEAAFMSYIRGGIRKSIWSRYPIKTIFIKNNRVRGINPKTGRECYGGICYITNKFFPESDLEIDHREGNYSLKNIDECSSFLKKLLYIDFDDLAFVSKGAHKIKSYAQRQGITYREAEIEKGVIAKCKQTAKVQLKELRDAGFDEEAIKNAKLRRECYRKLLGRVSDEVSIRRF
jgi:hypothetical protein